MNGLCRYLPAFNTARDYCAKELSTLYISPNYGMVNEDDAIARAKAFEFMIHAPHNPLVAQAYAALAYEIQKQYAYILRTGLVIEFNPDESDPYGGSPEGARADVITNNHLYIYPTAQGHGGEANPYSDNPLLAPSAFKFGKRHACINDIFRAVHDYFGHFVNGNGFGPRGEDHAWRSHVRMFSPLAAMAVTTETRGQNSWVNFGPHAEFNRTASAADTVYAPQKIGLLPHWFMIDA